MRNSGNRKNNTSGVKGIYWNKERVKWEAAITVNGKKINIIYCKSFNEAVCARLIAEQCLNWSGCDSSSPAFKYVQEMLKGKGIKNGKTCFVKR